MSEIQSRAQALLLQAQRIRDPRDAEWVLACQLAELEEVIEGTWKERHGKDVKTNSAMNMLLSMLEKENAEATSGERWLWKCSCHEFERDYRPTRTDLVTFCVACGGGYEYTLIDGTQAAVPPPPTLLGDRIISDTEIPPKP